MKWPIFIKDNINLFDADSFYFSGKRTRKSCDFIEFKEAIQSDIYIYILAMPNGPTRINMAQPCTAIFSSNNFHPCSTLLRFLI